MNPEQRASARVQREAPQILKNYMKRLIQKTERTLAEIEKRKENQMSQCRKILYGKKYGSRGSPCSHAATRDGWCSRHHPDAVAARDTKRKERWASVQRVADMERNYTQAANSLALLILSTDFDPALHMSEIMAIRDRYLRNTP
jgi:hypothetical protein